MILIGLGHRARAGKDAVAEHLVRNHGFKRYALADVLKESVNLVMGWDNAHSYGHLKEVVDDFWGFSPRYAYQRLGTEGYRKIVGESVWAKALRLRMESDAAKSPRPADFRAVIADVRFKAGEVPLVQELGGKLWRVDRPGLSQLVVPPSTAVGRLIDRVTGRSQRWSHQSEYDLRDFTDWDAVLKNDSTLEDLYALVDVELKKVLS